MQHDTSFADCLRGLEQFTELVIVEPGQILYEHHNVDRGLFFIEEGIMVGGIDSSDLHIFYAISHTLVFLSIEN